VDIHTIVDLAVIAVSAFTAYENNRVKLAIAELKVWIAQNFEPRKNPIAPD
jgi:hypothetical protein